jgi:hypothetical protein
MIFRGLQYTIPDKSDIVRSWVASVFAGSLRVGNFCAKHDGHTSGKRAHESLTRLPLFRRETLIKTNH